MEVSLGSLEKTSKAIEVAPWNGSHSFTFLSFLRLIARNRTVIRGESRKRGETTPLSDRGERTVPNVLDEPWKNRDWIIGIYNGDPSEMGLISTVCIILIHLN